MNANNSIYKKALKKIEKDQICKPSLCCLSVTGPTGPTGPAGPASISIGNTVTGLPGTAATVTNNGTSQNAILDFSIPAGVTGPQGLMGPTGPQGPTGPTGPTLLQTAYLATFNDGALVDGVPIASLARLPINRVELNVSNLVTVDTKEKVIKFNLPGYYKVSFTVSAYPEVQGPDFDPKTDIVSVGFRQTGTDNVYVGVGEWVFNGEAVELNAMGVVSVVNTNNTYELANLGKQTIYLNTPDLMDIASNSYFSNPLMTMVVEYLGRQGS